MKSLYIAGQIKGIRNYRERFDAAERAAKNYGWAVLNPAKLPKGLPHDRYMPVCLQMVNAADAVLLLDGWEQSTGATIEKLFAEYQGKKIYKQEYFCADIPRALRGQSDE